MQYNTVRQQSKTPILSTNIDKKSLETEFLIAICRLTGDKWQLKTLFLVIFDQCSLVLRTFSIAAYLVRVLENFISVFIYI